MLTFLFEIYGLSGKYFFSEKTDDDVYEKTFKYQMMEVCY